MRMRHGYIAEVEARYDFTELFAFCDLHASRVRCNRLQDVLLGMTADLPRYFDRQGFPIPSDGTHEPMLVWARMMENDPSYRCVAEETFPDGSRLSTVWLGLHHGFGYPPLIFETMYFSGDVETLSLIGGHEHDFHPILSFPDPFGEPGEQTEQLRYGSEEEALAAHREITRRLRKRWEV